NLSTSAYELLHSFSFAADGDYPTCDLLLASNGKFYGKAPGGGIYYDHDGTLFCLDPSNNDFTVVHYFNGGGGSHPEGNLIEYAPGKITGTTTDGGAYDGGTIFTYDFTTAQCGG